MRDPRQLEFNFSDQPREPTMVEYDVLVQQRLRRSSALCYCWSIANGHKAFADLNPPSTQVLRELLDYLDEDPNNFGQQYRDILEQVLGERAAAIILMSHRGREQFVREEIAQKVHVTCLASR